MTDHPDDCAVAPRPAAVGVLCALLWSEVAALVVAAVASLVQLVRGSDLPGVLIFLAVMTALGALALAVSARALWRGGARWARSPAMFWQILLVVLSASWLAVEVHAWTVIVLVLAAVAGVTLLVKPVVAWTVPADSARPTAAPPASHG